MSKGIELGKSQIESLMNGSTSLIVPIDINKFIDLEIREDMISYETKTPDDEHISGYFTNEYIPEFIKYASPLQAGDKDVFVKEEFYGNTSSDFTIGVPTRIDKHYLPYAVNYRRYKHKQPASEMTKEQSRFSIEVSDVRVVNVKDLTYNDIKELGCFDGICVPQSSSSMIHWLENHINNLMQQYDENYFTRTGNKIYQHKYKYKDNIYVFLNKVKVSN